MQLGTNLFREEPLPYLVYQPLPWQIQCVSQSRRTSRDSEVRGMAVPGQRADGCQAAWRCRQGANVMPGGQGKLGNVGEVFADKFKLVYINGNIPWKTWQLGFIV